jgi:Ca2+-binding EF-hand superfamily protein
MLVDFDKDGQIDKNDLLMTFSNLGILDIADEEIDGMLGEVRAKN